MDTNTLTIFFKQILSSTDKDITFFEVEGKIFFPDKNSSGLAYWLKKDKYTYGCSLYKELTNLNDLEFLKRHLLDNLHLFKNDLDAIKYGY